MGGTGGSSTGSGADAGQQLPPCPISPDPAACDRLLWQLVVDPQQVSNADYLPVSKPFAGLRVIRADSVIVRALVPLSEMTATVILDASTAIDFDHTKVPNTGKLADLFDALTGQWDAAYTAPVVNPILQWESQPPAGCCFQDWPPPQDTMLPLARPFHISRITVTGYATSSGAYAMTWQVRGY
jgi:hypothetical protein